MPKHPTPKTDSLYLETIKRPLLDFDLPPRCSVSLNTTNVYICLVCGKYLQGRGPSSHAYLHALHLDHHVFFNLSSLAVYILPQNYPVLSSSLNDIKAAANPLFSPSDILLLDSSQRPCYDLSHSPYVQGFVGLNSLKYPPYINPLLHLIAHIPPIRNLFLSSPHSTPLISHSSLLFRKLWSPSLFKPHVSPTQLLHYIESRNPSLFNSFSPLPFLLWYLNALHLDLARARSAPSPIFDAIQGALSHNSKTTPFLYLPIHLPPTPVFSPESQDQNIPQLLLSSLLAKYDAVNPESGYSVVKSPNYLLVYIDRNNKDASTNTNTNTTNTTSNTTTNTTSNTTSNTNTNKTTIIFDPTLLHLGNSSYRLIANLVYDASWSIQLLNLASSQWFHIHNLSVEKVKRELLFLKMAVLQVWQKI